MNIRRFFIPTLWNFDKLNINYDGILSKISKNYLKPTRRLDYAIIKFTSSTPSLDNAIIKLRAHTHDNGAIHAPFPSEHAAGLRVTLRRKMTEL